MRLGVALDFDGVLFDTYWFLPHLLASRAFSRGIDPLVLLLLDDILEAVGVWDRDPVYRLVGLGELQEDVWAARIAYSRPTGVHEILWLLRGLGLRIYIVCGSDATRWEKWRRVALYGLHTLVDDIVVYEPGGLGDALETLVEREGLERLVYVDDKPVNTCAAASVERVEPILYRFRPPYPLALAWRGAACGRVAGSPGELLETILEVLGARDPATPHHRSAQRGVVNARWY